MLAMHADHRLNQRAIELVRGAVAVATGQEPIISEEQVAAMPPASSFAELIRRYRHCDPKLGWGVTVPYETYAGMFGLTSKQLRYALATGRLGWALAERFVGHYPQAVPELVALLVRASLAPRESAPAGSTPPTQEG